MVRREQREEEKLATLKILVLDDAERAAQRCAALIASKARAAITRRGHCCLALSGGRTPWIMMRALAREDLSWPDIHIFQTDERVVPLDSPKRTLTQIREVLLSPVSLKSEQMHPMPVDTHDLTAAALQYGMLLRKIAGSPPVLDVIHLGLGADGHTASLVPGDPVLNVIGADVAISGPYQGHRRMTLTFPILNRAEALIWLVTGDTKAEVLRRLISGDTNFPAGRVGRDRAVIVVDKPAARLLRANDVREYYDYTT